MQSQSSKKMPFSIEFTPIVNESDDAKAITAATEEYKKIWENEKEKILNKFYDISGLSFRLGILHAKVLNGISTSYPFSLRYSIPTDTKKSTLIHELLHVLLAHNSVSVLCDNDSEKSLKFHMQIFLILYDIWTDLYSKDFADSQVKSDFLLTPTYKEAWDWALSFDRVDRLKRFQESIKTRKI